MAKTNQFVMWIDHFSDLILGHILDSLVDICFKPVACVLHSNKHGRGGQAMAEDIPGVPFRRVAFSGTLGYRGGSR